MGWQPATLPLSKLTNLESTESGVLGTAGSMIEGLQNALYCRGRPFLFRRRHGEVPGREAGYGGGSFESVSEVSSKRFARTAACLQLLKVLTYPLT